MPNSAAGPDGVPVVVCKRMAYLPAALLFHIYHQSLHQGILPNAWKIARVILLYKGRGSKEAASSYRPISLTNVAGKSLERIIARSFNDYLEAKNMLNNCQHGERRGRSTVTNLLAYESRIAEFMNNNKPCDVIAANFIRAYDKVCHKILCDKIKTFGIDRRFKS